MKSKTSFSNLFNNLFNRTLYIKNLTRFWPLWAMASFCGGILPLAVLTNWLRFRENITALEMTRAYYMVTAGGVPIVMLGYAILCAMAVWSYLYNARSVSLMHTLPIRREGLFVTNFLSGLTMVAIPCVVTGLLCVLFSLISGSFDAKSLLITILAVGGEGFFYFASATAVAFLTGNIFALPVLYFIFHFLVPALDFMVSVFLSCTTFGLSGTTYSGTAEFLSPTVYLMNHVRTNLEYTERAFEGMPGVTESVLSAVTLENAGIIAAYALLGVVLTGIAYALYRYRRSESAGDVIAVGWAKPVFLVGVTSVMALGGGQLLYVLFFQFSFSGFNGRYSLFPLIVFMTIAGLIGYYAAAMLLAKSLRVFEKSWSGVVATLVGCTLLCSFVFFDVFGVSSRIPGDAHLRSVYLRIAGNNYELYPGEDDALIEQVRDLHRVILENREYLENFDFDTAYSAETERALARGADPDEADTIKYIDTESLSLSYYLDSGRSVKREYNLRLAYSRVEQEGTLEYELDRLINSPEMKQKRLHAGDSHYQIAGGDFYIMTEDRYESLSSRELEQVMEALRADTAAGAWNYDWFRHVNQGDYALRLELSFERLDRNSEKERTWDYINVFLRPGMDKTIAALKQMGYLTDKNLITIWEWDENMPEYTIGEIPIPARDMEAYAEQDSVIIRRVDPIPARDMEAYAAEE